MAQDPLGIVENRQQWWNWIRLIWCENERLIQNGRRWEKVGWRPVQSLYLHMNTH